MPTFTSATNDTKVCGVRHILLPVNDPQSKMTPQQLNNYLQKNPNDFSKFVYTDSIDQTKVEHNIPLKNCLDNVPRKDPDQFKAQATQCIEQHIGELPCFSPKAMPPEWANKLQQMKPGTIDAVLIKDMNAVSIIQKPTMQR